MADEAGRRMEEPFGRKVEEKGCFGFSRPANDLVKSALLDRCALGLMGRSEVKRYHLALSGLGNNEQQQRQQLLLLLRGTIHS